MRRKLPDLDRSCLLVIDMQNYFLRVASPILDNVKRLIAFFRDTGLPVVFTAHGHRDPEKDGGMLLEWWGDLIMEGTWEHAIIKDVEPLEGERVIKKTRYSAFFGTDLEGYLRDLGVTDVVITGVMTNLCCETTARDAFMRDFAVFFVEDATSTSFPEMHKATLLNISYGFGTVLKTQDILSMRGSQEKRGG